MTAAPRALRPYQSEAVSAVMDQWGRDIRRTAVVLPTGTGKSTVIAQLAVESARMGLWVAMLAHRGELLDQMADTITEVDPTLPRAGIVRAERDESDAQIVAASFQTLVNEHRHAALGKRQVILVDETHHVTADSYRRVVEDFGPDAFMCGFTATLRRQDGKPLRELIQSIAFERNLRWALGEGYLVKPRGITVKIPDLDLGKVKTTAGDFQNKDLAEVMEAETPEIVKAILRHCEDRRPIVFAASVMAAHDIAEMLRAHGMHAEAVTGEMPYTARQEVYRRFRSGETRALVTVMVLTEGADFPMCDAVVIARPTQSQNLYSQMVGRALRPYPGKNDALVVDLVGTARVLKLVTVSSLDAGVVPKIVDTEGEELPPDDEEEVVSLAGGIAKNRRLGPLDTIGIDLLGPDETNILWLTTVKGVPFVAPQESGAAWFLWDSPNWSTDAETLYRVGKMPIKRGAGDGGWLTDPLPLSLAVAFVEDAVIEEGLSLPKRSASWRRYQPASEAQIRYARGLGIINPEGMTRARLSDEISIALVSAQLDGAR
jgi:superfamily II DNA or RNA helicase